MRKPAFDLDMRDLEMRDPTVDLELPEPTFEL
jgi:hypothetical protein